MSHEELHEAASDLTEATRDMHRAIVSLIEELEAVDWYQQRQQDLTRAQLVDAVVQQPSPAKGAGAQIWNVAPDTAR